MTEPYVKAGRGGAGNFYTKQELQDAAQASAESDLEANLTNRHIINDLIRTTTSSQPLPDYQHTGRGGAGNWVEPKVLHSQGLAQETSPDPTSVSSTTTANSLFGAGNTRRVVGQSKPTYRGGRGGAGNYTDFEEEVRKKRDEERRVREEMERRVERDVEAGLARPVKSYQGGPAAFEMGDMPERT